MFADPTTVTINAIANTLARVGTGMNSGSFSKDDGLVKLAISHSLGKNNQRVIRLDRTQTVADPLATGIYTNVTDSVWLVSKTPSVGLTIAQQKQLVDALVAYLTVTSGSNVTKLLGGES